MGSLASETDNKEARSDDVYFSLGIKQLGKGVLKVPRVLSLLSSLLERSVRKNEVEEARNNTLTIFHGIKAPDLSIHQYMDRIFKYSGCSPSCFVVANVYVDRFLDGTDTRLTSLTVHRLVITSVMLAAKFMDDAFFSNAYYAKVGGVSTGELNRLEMRFLFGIDFRLQVSVDTFVKYCMRLDCESAEGIERPMRACGIKESWSNKDDSPCAPAIMRF